MPGSRRRARCSARRRSEHEPRVAVRDRAGLTTRLPGRIDADGTSFASVSDLAEAMRRAKAAHGEHEKRTGVPDENWPDWYARYMAAEQAGPRATDLTPDRVAHARGNRRKRAGSRQ